MIDLLKSKTLLFSLSLLISAGVSAQCKGFTKRNCLPGLDPYLSNGQLNAAKMTSGQNAEVQLTFNKGLSYRLLICADPYFENTTYQLKGMDSTVLATDTISDTYAVQDIQVDQTQPLNLEIQLPEIENTTGIIRDGCVTILIGFKED
ncbi:MAG: hypothetical protein RJQ00_10605 [Vicingaceae bacterium]